MKKEEINIVAFIAPTPSFIDLNACGEYNGYVAIPSTHIAYGVRYDDELFDNIRVHGGLTYCGYATYNEKDAFGRYIREEYIGKRNGLFKKAEVIQAPGWTVLLSALGNEGRDVIPNGYYILGFDTCHLDDNRLNWNKEAVILETLRLKEQMIELHYNNIDNSWRKK